MSTVYISDSSRRFPQPKSDEMERKWEEALGKPTGAVCNWCGRKSSDGKLVNGECWVCRNSKDGMTRMEHSVLFHLFDVRHSPEDADIDASMKASEERDLKEEGESSGSHQNDY